ncbi:carboxymuconolactone decarboxylase family protein [Actinocorallia sp. A-T 12471]|uniref:carboxymuconolactone decarboxylase family protein n=1 Tax=Actinocorallia sp. A-T 12471 TaxID=3089813 RepID=UPI0029CDFAEC|nr:carboxymuconolactone decarboxylase family protein [Actinocorallia sp. A-T 12471]MDX6740824.1 carboxymuconolactone decarboxylase family protein [Actinocorallia sp. A-T 12471]
MSDGVRLPPVPRAEWSAEMTEFVEGFQSAVRGGGSAEGHQSGSNLLGVFARHPALAKAYLVFNGHLLNGSALSARQRELLILRVAHLSACPYEWAQHTILGVRAGLTPEEIARIPDGPGPGWAVGDVALLAAADDLLTRGEVSTETWTALADSFDDRGVMDVVFTVGAYALLAMALRSFGVQPEAELLPHLPSG